MSGENDAKGAQKQKFGISHHLLQPGGRNGNAAMRRRMPAPQASLAGRVPMLGGNSAEILCIGCAEHSADEKNVKRQQTRSALPANARPRGGIVAVKPGTAAHTPRMAQRA